MINHPAHSESSAEKAPSAPNSFTPSEIKKFRDETRGCSHVNHLNNAGASLMPDIVTRTIIDHLELETTVGGYEAAARQTHLRQEFYKGAARLLHCQPRNIAYTASATDSFTRAISSIPFRAGDIILTENDDYISNQIQFLSLQKRMGIRVVRVRNSSNGGVDLADLEEKLTKLQPRLMAITHIPTNSGLMQPVDQIGRIFHQHIKAHGDKTWYILDACQSVGQVNLDMTVLHCDFLSATSRKWLRGPRGAGFLFVSDRALDAGLEPLFLDMRGAKWIDKDSYQPRQDATRFEEWESAYALVLGSSTAIDYCLHIGVDRIRARVNELSGYLRRELAGIGKLRVLDKGPELAGLVTFTVDGSDPAFLVGELLKRKINVVPSFREFAVIDFDEKKTDWAIRASPHYFNTMEELDELVTALKAIL
jgi:selenocysteine lyase/cysteine desulfurase